MPRKTAPSNSPAPPVNEPLDQWRGKFGEEYIARNPADVRATREAEVAFDRILTQAGVKDEVRSVLEVGANIGINLAGLRRVLGPGAKLSAVEPNTAAHAALRRADLGLDEVVGATAQDMPFPDGAYDLVFTNGVLIHVPPAHLVAAMREIARVSRRFVLCSEYFSHQPVEAPYRGQQGLLWKRDFGRAYLQEVPGLRARAYGFLWQQEFQNFDDLNWWLFEKA